MASILLESRIVFSTRRFCGLERNLSAWYPDGPTACAHFAVFGLWDALSAVRLCMAIRERASSRSWRVNALRSAVNICWRCVACILLIISFAVASAWHRS
eukprot:scaffold31240_cov37-Tisochrysis_lutea.AAC.1